MYPTQPLLRASDNNFYGTTPAASCSGCSSSGTIFRMTPAGNLTTLYTFPLTTGVTPLPHRSRRLLLLHAATGCSMGQARLEASRWMDQSILAQCLH